MAAKTQGSWRSSSGRIRTPYTVKRSNAEKAATQNDMHSLQSCCLYSGASITAKAFPVGPMASCQKTHAFPHRPVGWLKSSHKSCGHVRETGLPLCQNGQLKIPKKERLQLRHCTRQSWSRCTIVHHISWTPHQYTSRSFVDVYT